jgi:CBS domain-containing protein
MVPLAEYATVPAGSTLMDAMLALEKAQEEFNHNKYRHRGVVIIDREKGVIGKLGQMDVLRALEPKEEDDDEVRKLRQFGFSSDFIRNRRRQKRLAAAPLKDLCRTVSRLKVEDFMQTPTEGEIIDEEASLEVAIQQMVVGNHLLSLLVTRERKIVGVLRMTDVFAAVFHAAKECELSPA